MKCWACFGTGKNDNDSDVCPICGGSKKQPEPEPKEYTLCPDCDYVNGVDCEAHKEK
jgi:hypothetical protein